MEQSTEYSTERIKELKELRLEYNELREKVRKIEDDMFEKGDFNTDGLISLEADSDPKDYAYGEKVGKMVKRLVFLRDTLSS